MHILIIGGTGTISRAIVQSLLRRIGKGTGQVHLLKNYSSGLWVIKPARVSQLLTLDSHHAWGMIKSGW